MSHRELSDLCRRVSDACLKGLCPAESKARLPPGLPRLSDLPPFVRLFLLGPPNVASQWPLRESERARARMEAVKQPNLWLTSSLRVRAR